MCFIKCGESDLRLLSSQVRTLVYCWRLFIMISFYSKTNEMHQFLKFIVFYSSTLHVSYGLFVHHQESKTVRTAKCISQTDSADCLLAGTRWNGVPSRSRVLGYIGIF
jgi:hypothetical protein